MAQQMVFNYNDLAVLQC